MNIMRTALFVSFLVTGAEASAGDFFRANLVKDLNTLPGQVSSQPAGFHAFAGKVYFAATRQDVGRELFATDGVSPDAQLIADLTPGSSSSSPTILGSAGGRLIVSANTSGSPPTGRTWAIDPAGGASVELVGFASSAIGNAAGRVVFGGLPDGTIWVTDGTPSGTSALFEGAGSQVDPFSKYTVCLLPDRFQLARHAQGGLELWTSDGTAAGTQMLQLLADSGDVRYADAVGGTCYFATMEADLDGWKLWHSNGTAAGTGLSLQSASGTPTTLRTTADAAYLLTYGAGTSQLWRADQALPIDTLPSDAFYLETTGSAIAYRVPAGSGSNFMVRDGSSAPARVVQLGGAPLTLPGGMNSALVAVGDLLFARGNENLYAIDPVAATATPIATGADVFLLEDYVSSGGIAYGVGASLAGWEVWRSDGTPGGTRLLHDIAWATGHGLANSLFAVRGNVLYFNAIDGSSNGGYTSGLVRSDGTEAGTQWLARSAYDGGNVTTPRAFDGGAVFVSYDPSTSTTSAYRTDAAFTQTQRIIGPVAGIPAFHGDENLLVYLCPGGGDSMCALRTGAALPQVVLSAAGTSQFAPVGTIGNAMIYFHRNALWRSDGTVPGTFALANLISLQNWTPTPFPPPLWPVYSIVHGGKLYFQACTAQVMSSCGLYTSDGTGNPVLLASVDGSVTAYAQYQGNVAFAAASVGTSQLWTSGGTPQTTQAVTAIPRSVHTLTNAGGLLHFIGYVTVPTEAYNYYVTDATAAGTRQVPLPVGSFMQGGPTTAYDDHVLFSCHTPGRGNEICVVDGAGTGLSTVIDIAPGTNHSFASVVAVTSDAAYFRADDGVHGWELWRVTRNSDALFADGFD